MYTGTYAPWENIPKYLKHHEIANPLEVVAYFFEIDSITGHAERFKEWRNYAVRTEYYINERSGPGALLYTWEEHVRLIEAMYLVWHQHRNSWGFRPASKEQLAEEKETWDYFPTNLNEQQLANPYLVAEECFKDATLAVYRDHLFEWLDMALTRSENRDPVIDAEDIINVYENMLALHAAAWVICQRYGKEPKLKKVGALPNDTSEKTDARNEEINKVDADCHEAMTSKSYILRPLYPQPTPGEKLGLQTIKEVILDCYKTVQLIAFLGSYSEPYIYFLMVLVSDEEKTEEGTLSCHIENNLQKFSRTHVILHKTASVIEAVKNGNRFWNNTLIHAHIFYKHDDLKLPATQEVFGIHLADAARKQWVTWGKHGLDLIHGGEFYMERNNLRLAAFTLHKATEAILKAIIQSVMGYRVQMHNIARLLRLTLLFTTQLRQLFQLNEVEGAQLFTFLKEAYAKSHYSESFEPDVKTIKRIHEKVIKLHETADNIYRKFIAENDR